MPYETIRYEVEESILTITLNRPDKLNAFTTQMLHEMIDAFDHADKDDAVKAVIITGAGRAFCAGADLSGGAATFDRASRNDRPQIPLGPDGEPDLTSDAARDGGGRLALRIFACLKPVIAAVNGAAVGVGATMLLPMDIRLASEEARFGFVFVRRGIVPEACSTWFLPRIVGVSQALEWTFTGRVFPHARRSPRGSSARFMRRASCCPPRARWRGKQRRTPAFPLRLLARCFGACSGRTIRWRPIRSRVGGFSRAVAAPMSRKAWLLFSKSANRILRIEFRRTYRGFFPGGRIGRTVDLCSALSCQLWPKAEASLRFG